MFGRTPLLALALTLPAACGAGAPDYVTFEKVSVPLDGLRAHRNPVTPYSELVGRLERSAAAEARDDRFQPVLSRHPVGSNGERMLVAAITPARGIFYYAEYGPYGLRPAAAVIEPRSRVDVCRFTVHWDRLPGGAYAPGIAWAGLAFPDLNCARPASADLSAAAEWRRRSASASYSVVARGSGAGLNAAIVLERWAGHAPAQPFDGGRSVAALAGGDDRIVRAIPVSADQEFYVETAAGRSFVGVAERMGGGSDTRCVVEGLRWSDLAGDGRRRSAATALCNGLFGEYRAGIRVRPFEPGPRVEVPIPANR